MDNYLGEVKSDFLIGVRTPWTLSSEQSWSRTNRLVGRLLVALGITTIIAVPFTSTLVHAWIIGVGAAIIAVFSLVYSYIVWRQDPRGTQADT